MYWIANAILKSSRSLGAGLIALAVVIIGLGAGCSSPTAPPNEVDGTQISDTMANPEEPLRRVSDTLLILPFDTASLPGQVHWEGVLDAGAHWRDRNGENYLVISEVFLGELSDRSLVAKLFGKAWNDRSGAMDSVWEIKEFNQDYFTFPTYSKGTLEITDLDHDGFAESSFIYRIEVDGTAPAKVKLLLHVHGKKYAIRGQLAGMDYDRGKVEEKHIDPAFKEIAPVFREFASKKWDAYEREYYKGWPEGVE